VHNDAAGGAWLTEEVARYLVEKRLVPAPGNRAGTERPVALSDAHAWRS